MKPWKQHVLLSFAGIIGSCVALFLIPENTPVWQWATVSSVVLVLLNYASFRRRKNPQPRTGGNSLHTTMIIVLAFLFLILDVIWSRYLRGLR
jgi:hypothetical protein